MNLGLESFEALAQNAFNRMLRLDPDAARRLGELEGKSILLELAAEDSPIRLYALPTAEGVRFQRHYDAVPDVTISGSMSVFLRHLTRGPTISDALTIRGDIELGQRFQRALAGLDPDWEDALARYVGDVPAHQAARLARATRAWFRHAIGVLSQDGAEYLKEEAMILAKRERVLSFMHEVDRLRADVDRLEKRLQRLTAHS
jgi:ubiquinone biosynthesis protein UbiJ